MSAATTSRPAVSVDELKRAWTAVQAGDFRTGTDRGAARSQRPTGPADPEWIPAAGERTIAVLGSAGTVGTSTVALALGLTAPDPVRVIECCSADASSMAAASTAELGLHTSGWRQGKRDHVLLERGEVAHTWRTERWKSLRLLTPNWMSRLPGFGYEGDDPDGYRDMPETIAFLDRYAEVISGPVETNTTVTSVSRDDDGYVVRTDQGDWRGCTAVLATGASSAQVSRPSPSSPASAPRPTSRR